MPVLTHVSNTKDVRWGQGLESCRFDAWGYKGTDKLYPMPLNIDIDYLHSHLGTLPALRRVARLALLDTTKPDITDTQVTRTVMQTLSQSPVKEIGDVYTHRIDQDRTTNYVIPLRTDGGTIEIVTNAAWGVSWRLGEDHELVKQYPSLAVCQPEDESTELWGPNRNNYLSPQVLEEVTGKYVDPDILAQRIRVLLINLYEKKAVDRRESISNYGKDALGDESLSQAYSVETDTYGGLPKIGISFLLGARKGIKSLHIFGYPCKDPKTLKPLREEAQAIGRFVRSFYAPSSFQNLA